MVGLVSAAINYRKKPSAAVKPANKEQVQTTVNTLAPDEAIKNNKDFWCSFKNKPQTETGKIFVTEGRFRADYETDSGNSKVETHIAFDGNWYYVWGGSTTTPFKIAADKVLKDGATQSAQQAIQSAISPESKSELLCGEWTGDKTSVSVPTGTEFFDISQRFSELQKASNSAEIKE
jgi:hypothetical protein